MIETFKLILRSANKSSILFIGNLSLTLINFLIVVVLSNYLAVNIYGQLREVMLYASFIFVLCSAGFSQSLYYFLNKTNNEIEILKITGSLRFLLFLFCLIIVCGFIILQFLNPILLKLDEIIILIIYLIALIFSSVDVNLSYYRKKAKLYFLVNSIISIIKLISIYLLSQSTYSLINYLLVLCIFQWIIVMTTYILLKKKYLGIFNISSDLNVVKKILNYSLPITLSSILGFLILNTDKILVSFLNLDKSKLAILSNVSFEAPVVSTIYFSFFTVALPGMIKSFDNSDFKDVVKQRFNYIHIVAKLVFPLVISFIVWNQAYVALIFGEFYRIYGFLFALFSTISLLRFCSHHDVFLATNNTSYILKYQTIEFFIHIALSFLLFHFYDLLGLVLASIITNYGYMFFVNLKSSKILKVKFSEILPFKFLLKRLMILTSTAILIKTVFDFIFPDIYWMLAMFIWLLIIFTVEVRLLKTQHS